MKSYNHLMEQLLTDSNIQLAVRNSSRGKRNRRDVKKYLVLLENPECEESQRLIREIRDGLCQYYNSPHRPKEIYDGITRKKRVIISPTYREQIAHHAVVNVLKPIMLHGMYEHSYGSLPDRGGHLGAVYIRKWISNDPENCKYVLKMDIRKYFESLPHNILIEKLREIIHDKYFLYLLITIIRATDNGIPLGFYTSQWFANWYLSRLDHYIKEELGAAHYIRYMDDMVVFGSDKNKLHETRKEIEGYLNTKLGLQMKPNWQVYRFDYISDDGMHHGRDLDFMGFRFFTDKTILRKTVMLKASRKARKISSKNRVTVYECRQILSYLGWIDATDTYGMYEAWIKPYVNFQKCKRKISRYDKRSARGERSS